jgi:hypothetical protein
VRFKIQGSRYKVQGTRFKRQEGGYKGNGMGIMNQREGKKTQFIKLSASGRRRTPSGKRITKGTLTGYKHVLSLLKEYETENKMQLRIQLLHRASLRTLKREKNYWSRFFISFSNYLFRKKGYYDNYVAGVFKTIKTFFNYLQNDKGYIVGNYQKLFRIPVQQATPVVLSPEQL